MLNLGRLVTQIGDEDVSSRRREPLGQGLGLPTELHRRHTWPKADVCPIEASIGGAELVVERMGGVDDRELRRLVDRHRVVTGHEDADDLLPEVRQPAGRLTRRLRKDPRHRDTAADVGMERGGRTHIECDLVDPIPQGQATRDEAGALDHLAVAGIAGRIDLRVQQRPARGDRQGLHPDHGGDRLDSRELGERRVVAAEARVVRADQDVGGVGRGEEATVGGVGAPRPSGGG